MEPAIDAVRAAHTMFHFLWLAGFERVFPCLENMRDIIGVKLLAGHPFQLIERLAHIIQKLAVDEFDRTLRRNSNDETLECCRRYGEGFARSLGGRFRRASDLQDRWSFRTI